MSFSLSTQSFEQVIRACGVGTLPFRSGCAPLLSIRRRREPARTLARGPAHLGNLSFQDINGCDWYGAVRVLSSHTGAETRDVLKDRSCCTTITDIHGPYEENAWRHTFGRHLHPQRTYLSTLRHRSRLHQHASAPRFLSPKGSVAKRLRQRDKRPGR